MINIIILILSLFIISLSIIGYGIGFQKVFIKRINEYNFGYLGLFGIFFLIIYSYLSNLFIPHSILHNFVFLFIGLLFFIYEFVFLSKTNIKKQTLLIFISLIVLFISILIYKNHDDFSYYHFPYTYFLTQHDLVIGIGNFGHGFRTHSSIFYLNSLFFIPFSNYFVFNFGALLILCFSNLILINKIFPKFCEIKISFDHRFFIFISLFVFAFINIFFYRIAEHGTDRSAQILILILLFEVIYILNLKFSSKNNLSEIFILLGLIASLKAFYILYFVVLLPIIFYIFESKKSIKKTLIYFLKNKVFILFSLLIFFVFLTNMLNTGCIIYPIHFSCLDWISWSIPTSEVKDMNNWYELWSKAGAGTNYRVNDSENYIQNFNWLINWVNLYFFTKVSDFLLGIIFLALCFLIYFKSKKKEKINKIKNLKTIFILIAILFLEWFYNHPALRYGGYALFFLFLIIPISSYLSLYNINKNVFIKKLLTIICVTIVIFLSRNSLRINEENNKYSYNPIINPYYDINNNHLRIEKKFKNILNRNKLCEKKKNVEECLGDYEKISKIFNKIVIENKR